MSLYGYGLTQYVVEFSFGVPTAVRGSCNSRTAVIFGEAAMAEPWDGVGTTVMAGTDKTQEGFLGGCDAQTDGETSVGMLRAR
jgi:hypothetical protein